MYKSNFIVKKAVKITRNLLKREIKEKSDYDLSENPTLKYYFKTCRAGLKYLEKNFVIDFDYCYFVTILLDFNFGKIKKPVFSGQPPEKIAIPLGISNEGLLSPRKTKEAVIKMLRQKRTYLKSLNTYRYFEFDRQRVAALSRGLTALNKDNPVFTLRFFSFVGGRTGVHLFIGKEKYDLTKEV